jgi:hypothetical protein
MKKYHLRKPTLNLFLLLISSQLSFCSLANTPSEMADLSLQEIFALSTDEMDGQTYETWKLNLLYKHSVLNGYLEGSQKLTHDEVLFDGNEPRTNKNFPVLPTKIKQEAFIANVTYSLTAEQSISFSLPYIIQSTDHLSIVPNYAGFNISSGSLGDITVNYSMLLNRWDNKKLSFSAGISMPSGSIDKKGDTPRASGDQQLPYTMQLGSGTWDLPVGFSYAEDKNGYSWGANVFLKARLGKNDRNYRLGNRLATSLWARWYLNDHVHPFIKVVFLDWGRISGRDEEITVPNPQFPYPAGITNPQFYGGQKANVVIGGDFFIESQGFTVEVGKPAYQSLNGIQPKEKVHFSLNWKVQF